MFVCGIYKFSTFILKEFKKKYEKLTPAAGIGNLRKLYKYED